MNFIKKAFTSLLAAWRGEIVTKREVWRIRDNDGNTYFTCDDKVIEQAKSRGFRVESEDFIVRCRMLPWHAMADGAPPTEPGTDTEFIVAVKRKATGKTYVFAATYLNAMVLRRHENDESESESDFVTITGWYTERADDLESDACWWSIIDIGSGDEVTHWMALPPEPGEGMDGADLDLHHVIKSQHEQIEWQASWITDLQRQVRNLLDPAPAPQAGEYVTQRPVQHFGVAEFVSPSWPSHVSAMYDKVRALAVEADSQGLAITIDLVSNKPLAMGNYTMMPSVRVRRQP